MDTVLKINYRLRTSDFDRARMIKPSAVMDIFQDIAGAHANILGCGFDDLIGSNKMWVLVRTRFTVETAPAMHSEVVVETWPLEPSRAGFRREYRMSDRNGNILIKGSSDWVIIDSVERRLVPAGDIYPIKEGFCTELMHTDRLAKLRDFEADSERFHVTPEYGDIDMNGHVNNIKYMDYVINALKDAADASIKSVQIDYRKEVLPGEGIDIYTLKTDREIMAKGTDSEGNIKFICKIEI